MSAAAAVCWNPCPDRGRVMSEVERRRDLSAGAKALYRRLLFLPSTRERGCAWPTLALLADALGRSVRQVQRDVGALEKLGLIFRERRGLGRGKSTRTTYWPIPHRPVTTGQKHPLRPDKGGSYDRTKAVVTTGQRRQRSNMESQSGKSRGTSSIEAARTQVQETAAGVTTTTTDTWRLNPDLAEEFRVTLQRIRGGAAPDAEILGKILAELPDEADARLYLADARERRMPVPRSYGWFVRDARDFWPDRRSAYTRKSGTEDRHNLELEPEASAANSEPTPEPKPPISAPATCPRCQGTGLADTGSLHDPHAFCGCEQGVMLRRIDPEAARRRNLEHNAAFDGLRAALRRRREADEQKRSGRLMARVSAGLMTMRSGIGRLSAMA